MEKNKNINLNVIANKVKQSGEIATPYGLAMTEQSGRSMVEMLGVLAIMGVLSVAGIAGYSYAMKKYRANELINETYKRASVVAMQLAAGQTPTLSEFGDSTVSGVSFELENEDEIAGHEDFVIYVSGMDKSVCKSISSMIGGSALLNLLDEAGEDIDCDNIENSSVGFLYDKNLLVGENSSLDIPDVPQEEPENKSCTTNADCPKSSQYCALIRKDGTSNECVNNSIGECTEKEAGEKTFIFAGQPGFQEIDGKKFFQSSNKMTWWSAKNYCEKFHKKLISLSDFGITGTTGKGPGYFGDYCGSTTCIFSHSYGWNLLIHAPGSSTYKNIYSLDAWWSEDKSSKGECFAYEIDFVYSEVNSEPIHYSPGLYAACID